MTMRLTIPPDEFLTELYRKFSNGESDDEICDWWQSIQADHVGMNCDYSCKCIDATFPSPKQKIALRQDFQTAIKANRAAKALKIQQWFKENPHLPQPSLGIIHKFLWAAKDNEEQSKKVMNRFYTLRGTDDEIFGNRDPCSPDAQRVHQYSHFACTPQFTDELYRVNISVLTDLDPNNFCPREWVRRIFYVADLRVRDDFSLGEIMIYDLNGFSVQHLVKFPLGLVKKMIVAAEGGLPTRIKQIHLINSPPFIDKVTALFRPFLKEKMAERVVVHMSGYEQLYKYVPKHNLPTEYGGTAGNLADYSRQWLKELEDNRDWFILEEKNIKRLYQEGNKNGKVFVDCGELFGVEGSFKQLTID